MVLGGILALALLAAPAHAAVTIGSSLADAPNAGTCQAGALSSPSCTLAAASIPMPSAAAGSVTSPIDGVVVRWRLRTNGSSAFSAAPRIVSGLSRLASGGTVTVAATAGTQEFPARLSIAAGQGVGVDVTTQPALTSAGIVATPVSGAWAASAPGASSAHLRSPRRRPCRCRRARRRRPSSVAAAARRSAATTPSAARRRSGRSTSADARGRRRQERKRWRRRQRDERR
jgi:hypothetical protein